MFKNNKFIKKKIKMKCFCDKKVYLPSAYLVNLLYNVLLYNI